VLHRFYAPDLELGAPRLTLAGDEARHLTRVLRLGVGDEVAVFDGRGLERRARVAATDRDEVSLTLGTRVEPSREVSFPITLAQAWLKGDAMDGIVRDATMLGVSTIQPLAAERCDVPGAAMARSQRLERWRRIAISSAKQCRRAVVPLIREAAPLGGVLDSAAGAVVVMLVEPGAAGASAVRRAPGAVDSPAGAIVLVGPEGGWTPAELDAASRAGVRFVTLGDRTLRAESVALVALPVLLFAWGEL
jgi:16S rRNA (uracil1498-N3)-methyltransferase